jgi:hypothetical protein
LILSESAESGDLGFLSLPVRVVWPGIGVIHDLLRAQVREKVAALGATFRIGSGRRPGSWNWPSVCWSAMSAVKSVRVYCSPADVIVPVHIHETSCRNLHGCSGSYIACCER